MRQWSLSHLLRTAEGRPPRGTHVRRTDPAGSEDGGGGHSGTGTGMCMPGASRDLQTEERGDRHMGLSIQEGLSGTVAISGMQNFPSENQGGLGLPGGQAHGRTHGEK